MILRPLLLAAVLAAPALAQVPSLDPRVPAGKHLSADGSLATRIDVGRPWQFLAQDAEINSRDQLLALPGSRAIIEPRPNSARLTLWGNLPQLSAVPVLESSVVLHDSRAFDLDFTLLRGRVVIANHKAKGPAKVWVRLPQEGWQLTLNEPGDEASIELFGRWPRGVPFTKTPKETDAPTRVAWLLALKGQLELKTETRTLTMSAPPGQAFFQWDSVVGNADRPQRRERAPDWADSSVDPSLEGKALLRLAQSFRESSKDKAPDAALRDLLSAADAVKDRTTAELSRELALYGLSAVDDVQRVAEALADEKHPALRATAILALRHWIGQSAGRDLALYQLLQEQLDYSKGQAETVLQLLHSPFEADQPETYETLIAYLGHSKVAIRELAAWQLGRLTDVGKEIKYDAGAPEAERAKAIAQWKALIPSGQLPKKQ
jgi:hypothetical protein